MPNAIVTGRYTGSIGPIKLEFILINSPDEGDTLQTVLSNPIGVTMFTGQTTTNLVNASANISDKTITIGPTNGETNLIALVIGF